MQYNSAPFKIAEPTRWIVILSNREHLEELAKASDDEFSFKEAINDVRHHSLPLKLSLFQRLLQKIQVEHTLGPHIHHNPYHLAVLRLHLTRNLEALYPEIRDEIVTSFAEVLDLTENGEQFRLTSFYHSLIWKYLEWKSVPALGVIQKIVCRATNRAFVGLPLCMHPVHLLSPSFLSSTTLGRNPDWIDLNIRYTLDLLKSGVIIGLFPKFMRS